ncbi:hypothetical protein NHX12_001426 [Muraenolepis orangiensis]|uniref:RUN and SH3 domain-containing protein 1 n=1 Tax=Muraenolepis orangiensis TaxID=630683 RepID=A0A9Q0IH71_9TELE|nr:hypothetical protein NHX12_001426 [Muraenolepis orangiensis]
MQSSTRPSQPPRPRRFETSRRTTTAAEPKSQGPGFRREDKNMNTITGSSPRRPTKASSENTRIRVGMQPRAPVAQSRPGIKKQGVAASNLAKPKVKGARARVPPAAKVAPPAPPPLPPLSPLLPLDPNCNEPSLPCLCCDGRSPQDNNSMFNHNHNNNNAVSLRNQMRLQPPPPPLAPRQEGKGVQERQQASPSKALPQPQAAPCAAAAAAVASAAENEGQKADKSVELDNKNNAKPLEEEDEDDSSGDIDVDVDQGDDDDDEDDDDDTLVPSCCDCPPSLLDLSLSTSSSSSSSTSISSCSDLESDCADLSTSLCSSHDQDDLATPFSPEEPPLPRDRHPPARAAPCLPLNRNISPPASRTTLDACSPDEGYPSAPASPSSDYLGAKGYTGHGHLDSEVTKLGLLDFLESVGEFGKMERFSQVIQVAHWDLDGEQHWDVLRDRLDHLDRLEKVNREVKLAYIARLHDKDLDLGDFEEQDFSDVLDEMGNIDMSWKLYKGRGGTLGDSQEFSDAGVDLTAPSDCDEPLASDSLTPSPADPPPRPPKPPARHASVNSDLHTYINISRETTSIAVSTCPTPTFSTFSPNSSPTFSTFRCEKALPPSPPSIPPLPSSQTLPYLTLYTAPLPPSLPTLAPPIPPPRRRHLARKEAQRLAALQARQEKTPLSLPPPTRRPPPLPPPPTISVPCSLASSSLPDIPLPPPPSFHTLDVEIRKLLMLAGLTQAELLKLSPELGVCVGGLEEEGGGDHAVPLRSNEAQEIRHIQGVEGDVALIRNAWSNKGQLDAVKRTEVREGKKEEESLDALRTTSFTEMARRRKRNTGNVSEQCYSNETFNYSPPLSDSPPPPPPRPLPPVPPSLSHHKACTLTANSARPERFDWLIAFTPDSEAALLSPPPPETTSTAVDTPKKLTSSSGSSTGSGPRVTTFKELRFRNRNTSPPTQVITDPDPDPNIITPDPDILYNLKWRREKKDSDDDDHQWEYTSQAQAFFMQPPPALTSMDALKEMLQRADEESRRAELRATQNIGCSARDGNLWTSGEERAKQGEEAKGKGKTLKEPETEVEVRGRADGGRTLESRTTVSSPPLSLAQSRNYPTASPYFLHASAPPYRPGYCELRPGPPAGPRGQAGGAEHRVASSPEPAGPRATVEAGDAELSPVRPCADDSGIAGESLDGDDGERWDSVSAFDSLFCDEPEKPRGPLPDCSTPYKNVDVVGLTCPEGAKDSPRPTRGASHAASLEGRGGGGDATRASKELPPLPTLYLYHPKSCPLHRGTPPRLSPIGALSPPHRPGALPPGLDGSGLGSPLFPRSHTLPALAAPLYYPYLYPPIPPRTPSPHAPPPRPPKRQQAAPKPRASTVRSVSFAGSVQSDRTSWMGEDVELPVRGPGLPSVCLQEKKALVSAVSLAVEAILAQFSSSRTAVQKCLCTALHGLLSDGLKPHQCDVIAGRRPNSAWGLVQASTKPGANTQAVYILQTRVGELPQLKQSKHKFNAFLFGLLNAKLLDFWLSHLQSCGDVLETFYHPSSFMRVSSSAAGHTLFQELLLLLQPLSLLTFNLDLLFQHHHLEPANQGPPISSPPGGPEHMEATGNTDGSSSSSSLASSGVSARSDAAPVATPVTVKRTNPQLLWVQEKEIRDLLPPPPLDDGSLAQQAGQVIQEGWEAVMRLGGRLSRNLSEMSLPAGQIQGKEDAEVYPPTGSDFPRVDSANNVPWGFGRLFGASKGAGSPTGHTPQTRRPSQWLGPGVTALTRMVSSSSLPTLKRAPEPQRESESEPAKEVEIQNIEEKPRPLRSVRTLCDHSGAGSELSFQKGEELVVLEGVDHDWIRCRQGEQEGLVPIGYTSLIM